MVSQHICKSEAEARAIMAGAPIVVEVDGLPDGYDYYGSILLPTKGFAFYNDVTQRVDIKPPFPAGSEVGIYAGENEVGRWRIGTVRVGESEVKRAGEAVAALLAQVERIKHTSHRYGLGMGHQRKESAYQESAKVAMRTPSLAYLFIIPTTPVEEK